MFPQVDYKSKRVLVMTVHKAMYGIDPILTEKVQLANFVEKKKTLILFDESDQAAVCMRNAIIDRSYPKYLVITNGLQKAIMVICNIRILSIFLSIFLMNIMAHCWRNVLIERR